MPVRAPNLHEVAPGDDLLIEQSIAGNERAFATLYRRHARYVAGVVYRLLGTDSELDDVMQETFCDALKALGSLKDPAGLRPWLARIAVRRVHKCLIKRRRWRWLVDATEKVAPLSSDPAERERVQALYRALEELPPNLRVPWTLHAIEGETLPQVAVICEISLATVKRRIAEASARLDRRLLQ